MNNKIKGERICYKLRMSQIKLDMADRLPCLVVKRSKNDHYKCIFSERLSVKIYTITLAMIVVKIFHSKTELDTNLRLIYAEARNKDGENY